MPYNVVLTNESMDKSFWQSKKLTKQYISAIFIMIYRAVIMFEPHPEKSLSVTIQMKAASSTVLSLSVTITCKNLWDTVMHRCNISLCMPSCFTPRLPSFQSHVAMGTMSKTVDNNIGWGRVLLELGQFAAVLWVEAILIMQKWVLHNSISTILQLIVTVCSTHLRTFFLFELKLAFGINGKWSCSPQLTKRRYIICTLWYFQLHWASGHS